MPEIVLFGINRIKEINKFISSHKVYKKEIYLHLKKLLKNMVEKDASDSIHRIIAEFPPDEQERVRYRLADVLKVVISQKLVPNKRGKLVLAKEILAVAFYKTMESYGGGGGSWDLDKFGVWL